jgi:hypothetical protein
VLSAEEYQGTVVEVMRTKSENSAADLYRPKIEYTDNAGNTHSFMPSSASNPQRYFVGDQVSVLENKNHFLWRAQINNFIELWLLPLILLIVGLADVALCCAIVIFLKVTSISHNGHTS